jgi:hypothetical protein
VRHPAESVECPECGALAGQRCWRKGYLTGLVHLARVGAYVTPGPEEPA